MLSRNGANSISTGSGLTNGAQHTIRGVGIISGIFSNEGAFAADVAGKSLSLYGSYNPLSFNKGVLQARNGGDLILGSNIDNSGGIISALMGSQVILVGGRNENSISNGMLVAEDGGRIVLRDLVKGSAILTSRGSGVLELAGGTLAGHDLKLQSRLTVTSGSLQDVTLSPGIDVHVENGGRVNLTGNVVNNGRIFLENLSCY